MVRSWFGIFDMSMSSIHLFSLDSRLDASLESERTCHEYAISLLKMSCQLHHLRQVAMNS
jgi:hypothetical protein